MKSLILQILSLAPLLVTSASAACQTTKVRKTLAWTYFVTGGPMGNPPPPFNYRNLTSPGRGYAWRERVQPSFDYDVSRAILLENDQDWKIVNCSSYFPPGDLGRQGCTSPDLALLAAPGGGKLGTLGPKGVWAVYQLVEFRITPVGPGTGDLQGEVQGWNEDGEKVDMQFTIRNSQPGYRVELTGEWGSIVQWQVKLRSARSSTPAVGFVLDDVVIVEDAISPSQDATCTYPTQTPTTPPEPIKTLKFDDLPTGPISTPYNGYTFNPPYRVASSPDAISSPHVLSSIPDTILSNRFFAKSFPFDIISFNINIKSNLAPADLNVGIQGYGPCYNIFTSGGGIAGNSKYFTPTTLSFTVNTTAWGFEKHRGMDIRVAETASGSLVPFDIDNLVVRSWGEGPPKGGLGLPGCERCGKYLGAFCEYPAMVRRIV